MQPQEPSRLNDFLISGAIASVLSPMLIIMISIVVNEWPGGYPFSTAFIGFWFVFAIIGTIIFFIISLIIRAMLGPNNHNTPNAYNPTNYQVPYSPIPNSSNKLEAYNSLEKLAELKDKGVLSEEEYQEEKEKILK